MLLYVCLWYQYEQKRAIHHFSRGVLKRLRFYIKMYNKKCKNCRHGERRAVAPLPSWILPAAQETQYIRRARMGGVDLTK